MPAPLVAPPKLPQFFFSTSFCTRSGHEAPLFVATHVADSVQDLL
jgi:hypothetical protein